jgi:hypothetical protein
MRCAVRGLVLLLLIVLTQTGFSADPSAKRTAREALKPFAVAVRSGH